MMESEIEIKIDFLRNFNKNLADGEIYSNQILPVIEAIRELLKVKENRGLLNATHWNVFDELMLKLFTEDPFMSSSHGIVLITEVFRLFRNSCVGSVNNQNLIIRSSNLLRCTTHFLKLLLAKDTDLCNDEVTICLRCCLQFMGNLVVNNDEAQRTLWKFYEDLDAFSILLKNHDEKIQEYSTMILYNCLTPLHKKQIISSEKGHALINIIITSVIERSSDWSFLCLEKLIEEKCFIAEVYDNLQLQCRFVILDLIAEHLSRSKSQHHLSIPMSVISHIASHFKNNAMNIVKLCSSEHMTLEPVEISKFLSVLCAASADENYYSLFNEEYALLETAIDVLRSVHFIGKHEGNVFTPIQSLKAESEAGDIECNSAHGFKRNLVRLIGNLSAQSKENQDKVRQLDGIPLLLDCCNIDSRNPYIMQWCILAIRNLLDKNPENQAVVASISVTGDLVNSPLLKELGFVVENHDGHVVLRTSASVEKSTMNVN